MYIFLSKNSKIKTFIIFSRTIIIYELYSMYK